MMQYKIYKNGRFIFFKDIFTAKHYADKIEKQTGKRLAIIKTYKLINKIKRHENNNKKI